MTGIREGGISVPSSAVWGPEAMLLTQIHLPSLKMGWGFLLQANDITPTFTTSPKHSLLLSAAGSEIRSPTRT